MIKYAIATLLLLAACGHNSGGSNVDGGGSGDGDGGGSGSGSGSGTGDGGHMTVDCAGGPILTNPQCSNCIDDDGDGFIDGADIECTGAADNDESSFATGIPGDNIDETKQDCFFDGNSGAGDDGCNVHICCLLGAPDKAHCPIHPNQYDPAQCPPPIGTNPLSQQCIDFCSPLVPAGCDCFACCTVCDPTDPTHCTDIEENPAASPDCTTDSIFDPTKCAPCTKVAACTGGACGGDTCVLCPGQDPSSLPAACNNTNACPGTDIPCATEADCGNTGYCSNGCCIAIIN